MGEQVGNNVGDKTGNSGTIPGEQYLTSETIGRGGGRTVEGTVGERRGNNAPVPARSVLVPLITCPHCGRSFAYVP